MTGSSRAIELAREVKKRYSVSWVYENAKRAVSEVVIHGCLAVRGFADVDSLAGLTAVEALLKLRADVGEVVELQVVAFPQEGVVREPDAEELLWRAAEMGCDVMGGIPWIEYAEEDMKRHIDTVFDIATTFDKDVTMLTDDTGDPTLRTTEMLTLETRRRDWAGRVSACHARALALYPMQRLVRLAGLMKTNGVGLVISPHTGSLYAPVRNLTSLGVNVALGQDDIEDAYYPFGRGSMLEIIFLAAHLFRMTDSQSLEHLFNMATFNAAHIMKLNGYGIAVGGEANLIVLDAPTVRESVKNHNPPRYVISRGRIIAESGELKQEIIGLGKH
ncbi:MAG TPA: cytosine deaminase [Candidatus Caldiarchaeum subterraneum]|uniref:Cytosine deaminase n=1 Tax=Caldiarchaeum subterraneum TaxID=311458 RepID=A0A832ZX70_CALS0|nr:cytosine deaminase [Candidatus Caldarchaeum subterraneum]